eukprot:766283-Hanusia_phi.AAC.4
MARGMVVALPFEGNQKINVHKKPAMNLFTGVRVRSCELVRSLLLGATSKEEAAIWGSLCES